MKNSLSFSDLNDFVERAYSCSCAHGFHDEPLSVQHCLMLVLSEVSEAVEADRCGRSLRGDLGVFDDALRTVNFSVAFEDYVKDMVEDELADVAIRLFDLAGMLGVRFSDDVVDDSVYSRWLSTESGLSFCVCCYHLCSVLTLATGDNKFSPSRLISGALSYLFCLCECFGIDLREHISLKMCYNELRPILHGKKY